MTDTFDKSKLLKIDSWLLDHAKYAKDIDRRIAVMTLKSKQLENLFDLVNSEGFLAGETYDGFLCEENPITDFKTFHFFFQGEETFSVALGFNSDTDIGALKVPPSASITRIFFVQGLNLGLEPVGSLMGALFAIGGNNIIFTLLTDEDGFFSLQNNNQLISSTPVPEGIYSIIVKAEGSGGTQYVDQITITVLATALISNINLSNVSIESGASIGTSVGALSTSGGEPPIVFVLEAQFDSLGAPVDVFEIVGTTLQTKAAVGVIGTDYQLFISAEDSRVALPSDERIRVEEFEISVVASTFLNSNSLIFDSIDERVAIPNDISLWGNQNFSGSFWINANNKGSAQYIAAKFREAGKRSWGIRVNTAGTIAIVYSQTGVTADTTTTTGSVTFGIWHHIAFAFDGTLGTPKMKIWIDSVLDVDEDTLLTALFNNTDVEMLIGALNQPLPTSASDFFDGNIDEVSIYNTTLTTGQVEEIYNLGIPKNVETLSSAAGLISYWRMGDDFSGGIQPDTTGANDGTGVNMNNSNKSTDVPT